MRTARFEVEIDRTFRTTLRATCDTEAAWDAVEVFLRLAHSARVPAATTAGDRAHRFMVELVEREGSATPAGVLTADVVRVSR